jgi:hypothetical protein
MSTTNTAFLAHESFSFQGSFFDGIHAVHFGPIQQLNLTLVLPQFNIILVIASYKKKLKLEYR